MRLLMLTLSSEPASAMFSTLSLHDALPIYPQVPVRVEAAAVRRPEPRALGGRRAGERGFAEHGAVGLGRPEQRSEEHTSELQSHRELVCRLLLEKKSINMRPRCQR